MKEGCSTAQKFETGDKALSKSVFGEPQIVTILDGPKKWRGRITYLARHKDHEMWYDEKFLRHISDREE